jgi:CxxC motif-containing protein (DUF1111 family)
MRAAVASKRLGISLGLLGLCLVAAGAIGSGLARAGSNDRDRDKDKAKSDSIAAGYEIFNREWLPNDPRGHGGDGLGPAFNDSSCIACHNSGGSGGAGPISKNIDILSASRNTNFMGNQPQPAPTQPAAPEPGGVANFAPAAVAVAPGAACPPPSTAQLEPLFQIHPGFRNSKTVVLHKFGTDPGYEAFRSKLVGNGNVNGPMQAVPFSPDGLNFISFNTGMAVDGGSPPVQQLRNSADVFLANEVMTKARQGNVDTRLTAAMARMNEVRTAVAMTRATMTGTVNLGPFQVTRSQRNPTPLFGLGLIDAIPESAIVAMAKKQAKETPQTAGRVVRVPDGRVGRLGWKGQTANSEDFVLNACAVEVGLEVPGHAQAITPQAPRYKGPGLDLTAGECSSLVDYVRSLPRPIERESSSAIEAKYLAAGKAIFAKIGCVNCHTSKLGEVEGLYSDLLVHDMGDDTADSGSYNGSDEGTDEPLVPLIAVANGEQPAPAPQQNPGAPTEPRSARKKEWRTPPLWGFRDSGPYLHDGRAQTLEQAVALHGGQGAASAQAFFQLSPTERLQLEAFLKSLVAPAAQSREMARAE